MSFSKFWSCIGVASVQRRDSSAFWDVNYDISLEMKKKKKSPPLSNIWFKNANVLIFGDATIRKLWSPNTEVRIVTLHFSLLTLALRTGALIKAEPCLMSLVTPVHIGPMWSHYLSESEFRSPCILKNTTYFISSACIFYLHTLWLISCASCYWGFHAK